MKYSVACKCGRTMIVQGGDAGATKPCMCGNDLAIPSLSILRQSKVEEPKAAKDHSKKGAVVFWLLVAAIAIGGTLFHGPFSLLTAIPIIFIARIWFALQILAQMTPGNALIVLLIPFMPTVFFFKRIDITWKPFVFGLLGYYLFFASISAPR